jgi:hypothetical protein
MCVSKIFTERRKEKEEKPTGMDRRTEERKAGK